jgi:hypothetical protein
MLYTDDTIITGPYEDMIKSTIKDIGKLYDITHKSTVSDFLGVNISRTKSDGSITLTQQKLIKSIIADLGLKDESTTRATPSLSSKILHAYPGSPPYEGSWSYRSVIGKLNFLEKSTRPDLAYAVHQCARFMSSPTEEHAKAVKHIDRYLLATSDKGTIMRPNRDGLVCYSDADFAGNWHPQTAGEDSNTACSRSGSLVKYANCPLMWGSRMQTEIVLSSTESQYISLSQSLRDVLPLIRLINELN